MRSELPRLPDERQESYISNYALTPYDSSILCCDISLSDYFEEAAKHTAYPKTLANLIISQLLSLTSSEDFSVSLSPEYLAELAELIGTKRINSSTAKTLIKRIFDENISPTKIAESENLFQISDVETLSLLAEEAIKDSPSSLLDYRNGKKNAAKAILGKAMSKSSGRADPVILNEVLQKLLERGPD